MAEYDLSYYFSSDLLHRLYHVPAFGDGHVQHYTQGYAEVLTQAQEHPERATHDSDVLQYFALEVYAYDIAVPGVGCPGTLPTQTSAAAEHNSSDIATASSAHASSAHHAMTHTPNPTIRAAYSTVLSVPSVSVVSKCVYVPG